MTIDRTHYEGCWRDHLRCAVFRAEELASLAADLHWMARRYADGRSSYATRLHNDCTRRLLGLGVKLDPTADGTVWARDDGAALARLAALDADAAALGRLEPAQPEEEDVYALAAHVARVFGSWRARAPGERRRLARAALRSLAAQREGRAAVRVVSLDLWWPAPPPVPHVERRGANAGVGWVRVEIAA